MRKDQVKLGQVKNIPALIFAGTFVNHMKYGDKSGQSHTGLHVISEFVSKKTGRALSAGDITVGNSIEGTLNGLSTTVVIKDVDARAKTFSADVNTHGTAKASTFFPTGASLVEAKEFIKQAWKDVGITV